MQVLSQIHQKARSSGMTLTFHKKSSLLLIWEEIGGLSQVAENFGVVNVD